MKNYLIKFFELEESDIASKDVVKAGVSLLVALGFVFLPIFM